MEIAKQIAGFSPAEADDLRKAIGKKIHALMASLKDKFIEGCVANDDRRRGRPPALGGHGEGAGLLVQQVARRLLRADLLPHRLAAREPPVRVHGGADQLGDEHEGPRAVLRQRLPRARDRGAAARRERVADRLRRRRRQDPLRAQRRQGRRRARRAARSSAAREEGGPFESIWDFTERVDPSVVNKRALESLVKCGALARRVAAGDARRCSSRRSPTARSSRPTGSPARARSSTSVRRAETAPARRTTRRSRPSEFEKPELLRLEKETLGLYVSEHPLSSLRDRAAREDRRDDRRARAPPRRRDRRRRRDRQRGQAADDQARRADGLPPARRRHRRRSRSSSSLAAYAAARELLRRRPDRSIVKGRVDHKEGETKLHRARGLRVRGGARAARGAAADRRDAAPRRA